MNGIVGMLSVCTLDWNSLVIASERSMFKLALIVSYATFLFAVLPDFADIELEESAFQLPDLPADILEADIADVDIQRIDLQRDDDFDDIQAVVHNDALDNIPTRKRPPLKTTEARSIKASMQKQLNRAWRKVDNASKQQTSLAKGWNKMMLRVGDFVSEGDSQHMGHANRYDCAAWMRLGWTEIGSRKHAGAHHEGHEQDVKESTHGAQALSTFGALTHSRITNRVQQLMTTVLDDDVISVFILRRRDATPVLVRFGILQDILEDTARYLVQAEDVNGQLYWKPVKREEYKKLFPRAKTNKGIIDIYGILIDMIVEKTGPLGSTNTITERRRIFVPPMFLERGTAACLKDAVEAVDPSLTTEAINETYQSSDRWCVVQDVPDNCNAEIKVCAYYSKVFCNRVLYSYVGCYTHRMHRSLVRATSEDAIIGDEHAQQFVLKVHGRRSALLQTLWTFVKENLDVRYGAPDPFYKRMNKHLLNRTMLRYEDHIRSSADIANPDHQNTMKQLRGACDNLADVLPDDWRLGRMITYLNQALFKPHSIADEPTHNICDSIARSIVAFVAYRCLPLPFARAHARTSATSFTRRLSTLASSEEWCTLIRGRTAGEVATSLWAIQWRRKVVIGLVLRCGDGRIQTTC